ncbi:MAG: hypothetical protein ACO1N0_07935 [Fluviicola sp.]
MDTINLKTIMISLKEEFKKNAEKYSEAVDLLFTQPPLEQKLRAKAQRIEKSSFKKCNEVCTILKETTNLFQIEEFMDHQSPHVRYLSAAYCLYSDPEKAEKILEELIESYSGEIHLKALTTLKAWRNIPWAEDRYK